MTPAYPLQWPAGRPRTPAHRREDSRFDISNDRARREMLHQCDLMGATHVVISSNVELRLDGFPYANRRPPDDPAVAIYFMRGGIEVCFSCDRYRRVWENMRAIGKTVEAMRGISRWGAHEVLDQMFRGFTALPPPDQMSVITTPVSRNWWDVLNVSSNCPMPVANAAWKALCRSTPENDRYEINAAIETARKGVK